MRTTTRGTRPRSWWLGPLATCLLTSACTYNVLPSEVPAIEERQDLKLAGAAVSVVNAESNGEDFLIYSSSRHGSFHGNRKAWCDVLVAALSRELTKRGATVAADAPTRFQVSLPDISGHSGYATVGFKVRVVVAGPYGWTKSYDGNAAAAAGWSMGGVAERSAEFALAEVVKALLADPSFVTSLGAKS